MAVFLVLVDFIDTGLCLDSVDAVIVSWAVGLQWGSCSMFSWIHSVILWYFKSCVSSLLSSCSLFHRVPMYILMALILLLLLVCPLHISSYSCPHSHRFKIIISATCRYASCLFLTIAVYKHVIAALTTIFYTFAHILACSCISNDTSMSWNDGSQTSFNK